MFAQVKDSQFSFIVIGKVMEAYFPKSRSATLTLLSRHSSGSNSF